MTRHIDDLPVNDDRPAPNPPGAWSQSLLTPGLGARTVVTEEVIAPDWADVVAEVIRRQQSHDD